MRTILFFKALTGINSRGKVIAEGRATMNKIIRIILGSCTICLATQVGWASPESQGRMLLLRDATYERDLQWEASADKAITPAKVIRWIMGLHGEILSAPSPTEFQPIVNAHDGQVRIIAAIAYKF